MTDSDAHVREVTARSLPGLVDHLCARSAVIRRVVERYGQPLPWRREPGFASLAYTILEQQVSLASARAAYERLVAVTGTLTAETFSTLSDETLRSVGFSRQKIEYCRGLAEDVISGRLNLTALDRAHDNDVRDTLTAVRGIGRWTADIYLLHSLGRPDIWPVGDLALRVAVGEELELGAPPALDKLEEIGREFVPLRSVAARVFWQGYLSRRGIGSVT